MTSGGTDGMYVVTGGPDKVIEGAPNEVTAGGREDPCVVTGVCCMTPGGT